MQRPGRAKRWLWIVALALLASDFLSPALQSVYGFSNGEGASTVLGQPNFTSTLSPSEGLRTPSNLAFDSSGNLWIADAGNNRIVEEAGVGSGGTTSLGVVLGQPNSSTGNANLTQSTLDNPSGMAFDSAGDLWATDTNNSRVLEFASPLTNDESASVVIGQVNFTSVGGAAPQATLDYPGAVTFDSSGNLWVVDSGDNRVLEYKTPFRTGENASIAIGQPDLTSSGNSTTASGLAFPASARFDSSGDLWVADAGNNRILEYKAPFSTGMNASLVIGQSNFTSSAGAATQSGLDLPESLAFSNGNLWVADTFNDRVVEYTAPFSDGMQATTVVGQPNFTSVTLATTRTGFDRPSEVAFDKAGDLWVADLYNNRVLEFAPPFQNGAPATRVVGQSDYLSNLLGGGYSLYGPSSLTVDSSGNVWAVDTGNNRVVEYKAPISSGMNASLVLGQPTLTLSSPGSGSGGLWAPDAAVFDKSGDLWVSDTDNNRVMEYTQPFSDGENASLVIGQPSFDTSSPGGGQNGLYDPLGLAFDSSGNLWVVDAGNARVLEFEAPFSSGMNASLVLGEAGFSSVAGSSPNGLALPAGLAFDASGNLWVSDVEANAVMEFAKPFSTGETGSVVFGGSISSFTPSASSLAGPFGLAFDKSGDLWVGDLGYNRVLEFAAPVVKGEQASLVIGQPNFTTGAPGTSQSGLTEPFGLALDNSGNLWVADWFNDRLLEFPAAGTSGTSSSSSSSSTSKTTVTTVSIPSSSSSSLTSTSTSSSSSVGSSSGSSTKSTTSTTSLSSSTSSTSSTVPEFPMGAPAVFVVVLFSALALSSWARKGPGRT